MAAHSALVPRFDHAARWRAGLLTLVVIAAAGSSAWASDAQAWAEHLHDSMKCGLMHSETRDGENLAGGKKLDAAAAVTCGRNAVVVCRYRPAGNRIGKAPY